MHFPRSRSKSEVVSFQAGAFRLCERDNTDNAMWIKWPNDPAEEQFRQVTVIRIYIASCSRRGIRMNKYVDWLKQSKHREHGKPREILRGRARRPLVNSRVIVEISLVACRAKTKDSAMKQELYSRISEMANGNSEVVYSCN